MLARTMFVAAFVLFPMSFRLTVGAEPGAAYGKPAADEGTAPLTEPVTVGWEDGCVVHRFSVAEGRWVTSRGPPTPLSRPIIPAVGPHAAVALAGSGVYGGWHHDLHTGQWSVVPESPIRSRHTPNLPAVAFVGRDLVVWGVIGADPQGAVLDTAAMKWRPMAPAPVGPRYRCLKAAVGGKLLVWGGYGPVVEDGRIVSSGPLGDGAVYDVRADRWVKMPPPPVGFQYGCAGVAWNGRLVVFGGVTKHVLCRTGMSFDPETEAWEQLPPMPFDVGVNAACVVVDDRLFVWSGSPPDGGGGATPQGAVYDFWTRQWKAVPEAPIGPRLLAFARGAGPGVTVWGGWSEGHRGGATFHTDGATYDFVKRTWNQIPDLPGRVPYEMHPGW